MYSPHVNLSGLKTMHDSQNPRSILFYVSFPSQEPQSIPILQLVFRMKFTAKFYTANATYDLFTVFSDIKAVNRKFFHWGECDDQHQDCVTWANEGMCDEEQEKMHSWCPWSCHKCAPELMGKYLSKVHLQQAAVPSLIS